MQYVKMSKNANLFSKKYPAAKGNSKKAKLFRKKLQKQKEQLRYQRKKTRMLNQMMGIEVFKRNKEISRAQLAYIKQRVMKKVDEVLKNRRKPDGSQSSRSGDNGVREIARIDGNVSDEKVACQPEVDRRPVARARS